MFLTELSETAHALGDFPIRETAKDAEEHFLLAIFQCAAGFLIPASRLVETLIGQELNDFLIDPYRPSGNEPDRLYKAVGSLRFQENTRSAELQGHG